MNENIKEFNFKLKTNMKFGIGIVKDLNEILLKYRFKKAGFIIDHGVYGSDQIEEMIKRVESARISINVYVNRVSEPDYDYLDEFKKQLNGVDFDCLVGVGGGSTLDLTKGMAILLKNPGKAISYRGFPELGNNPLPVIAIPTTAGTGSEVTYNAVFTDNREKKKLGINSELNYPICALLDPSLTLSCPKAVTVSSGIDALTHALESFVAKNATPISRIFSKEAFKLIFNNLRKVTEDPRNIEIRSKLLFGSYLAGVALCNSGAGPAGAMSYPLGAIYKVPHGLAGGVFLPAIVKLNVDRGYMGYTELYDLIEDSDKNLSINRKNERFCKLLEELCVRLGVPQKLTAFGIAERDIDCLVEHTFKGLKAAIEQNPIQVNEEDVRKILKAMF